MKKPLDCFQVPVRAAVVTATMLASCSAPDEHVHAPDSPTRAAEIEFSGVRRVGGDLQARAQREPGAGVDGADAWSFGLARITTSLPAGYPPPTPPGAIELKRYPSVRRAEVSGKGSPDIGMNFAFWPLFGHIKQREIAMTSPVELDYAAAGEPASAMGEWTMSFLYREASLGELGSDGNVRIVDQPAKTVLALGFQGDYAWREAAAGLERLQQWLAGQEDWEVAGRPRALYYNGPEKRAEEKWGEVQLPVRPKRAATGS